MSGVKRYQHIGSLVESNEAMLSLYPMATQYVLASDYDTLRTANQRLESELAAIRSTIRTDNSAVIAGLQADKQRLEAKCSLLDTARIDAEEKQWAAERENRRLEGEAVLLREQLERWHSLDLKRDAEVARLREALKDIADDYSERFDMESPSTNPGMKFVVEQARAALAGDWGE